MNVCVSLASKNCEIVLCMVGDHPGRKGETLLEFKLHKETNSRTENVARCSYS